ncbi:MAG: helix-turn-helix domain-containing protein [Actinomycetota bacterium]|nr:helix-turn-helix domain-containing protein [Actinomycetota bacterium]
MHAFDVLGDPVRRRILELLVADITTDTTADTEAGSGTPAGTIAAQIRAEFSIGQPAVSQQLKVLRDNGFATVTVDGQRRLYSVDTAGLRAADAWLDRYRRLWSGRLDALEIELRRGRRHRRGTSTDGTTTS